jgi:hypothetical protein
LPGRREPKLTLAAAVQRVKDELALDMPTATARDTVVAAWSQLNWIADVHRADLTMLQQVSEICGELGISTGWEIERIAPRADITPAPFIGLGLAALAGLSPALAPPVTEGTPDFEARTRRRAAFLGAEFNPSSAEKFLVVHREPTEPEPEPEPMPEPELEPAPTPAPAPSSAADELLGQPQPEVCSIRRRPNRSGGSSAPVNCPDQPEASAANANETMDAPWLLYRLPLMEQLLLLGIDPHGCLPSNGPPASP